MLYYDCVHLYLIKMVAIYMQIKCDSASWQFVSRTLSITNHLCPYLSSSGPIWRHFSQGRTNTILRGCKHIQAGYQPVLPPPPWLTGLSLLIPKDDFFYSAAFHNLSFPMWHSTDLHSFFAVLKMILGLKASSWPT